MQKLPDIVQQYLDDTDKTYNATDLVSGLWKEIPFPNVDSSPTCFLESQCGSLFYS